MAAEIPTKEVPNLGIKIEDYAALDSRVAQFGIPVRAIEMRMHQVANGRPTDVVLARLAIDYFCDRIVELKGFGASVHW